MPSPPTTNIESLQHEGRLFQPPADFAAKAHIKSMEELEALRAEANADRDKFWGRMAESELEWFKKWDTVLDWQPPHAQWFVGGKINISHNCLDRHLGTWRRNKAALIWEGEPGDTRTLTYQQLHREVCRFSNVLKNLGVKPGDRVALYMPLIPELAISMLACARIGATHSVVFGGFSSAALIDRINDAQCSLVVTADGGWRRGKEVKLKPAVDEALKDTPSLKNCIVVRRTASEIHLEAGRDHWWRWEASHGRANLTKFQKFPEAPTPLANTSPHQVDRNDRVRNELTELDNKQASHQAVTNKLFALFNPQF